MSKELETYIHLSKYSRWNEVEERRETWEETVNRLMGFWDKHLDGKFPQARKQVGSAIMGKDVMGSMRTMMTAGAALEKDNLCGFNCAGIAVSHPRVFDEIFYILLVGAGVGFSVERQYIGKLPEIAEEFFDTDTTIIVRDSRAGWAKALKELISLLYQGDIPKFDTSQVRPAGARLKTMGGRASGPEPLLALFRKVIRVFQNAKGRKLNSIECHDIICFIADAVIVGGVRRSATISFSNLTDDRMRRAKSGEWYIVAPQRVLANNSTMYTEKPDMQAFSKEWRSMYVSKSGERGIVNQEALKRKAESCGRITDMFDFLLNPCGEAILRHTGGLCNLSTCIIKPTDTLSDIVEKVKIATIIGTWQSTLTNFKYIRKVWTNNAEEERLLGVSFTGIMDHPILGNLNATDEDMDEFVDTQEEDGDADGIMTLGDVLSFLKGIATKTNVIWADKLRIPVAKQIGLVKPEGTTSLLCGTSSGMHPRYAGHYIRRVRQDKKDPLSRLMIDQGIPWIDEGDKFCFSFFEKAPDSCVTDSDINALYQLKLWKIYAKYWCDGNPSQTINYTDDEYFAVADWVWQNWDIIGGLSFFPKDDHIYDNAPLEEITAEQYAGFMKVFPTNIEWNKISEYEKEDTSIQEMSVACSGGQCEII